MLQAPSAAVGRINFEEDVGKGGGGRKGSTHIDSELSTTLHKPTNVLSEHLTGLISVQNSSLGNMTACNYITFLPFYFLVNTTPCYQLLWSFRMGVQNPSSLYNQYFYNSKGSSESVAAQNDEPTENYHLNLQLPLALQSFVVSFSSLFICLDHNFTVHGVISSSCVQIFLEETTVKMCKKCHSVPKHK